MKVVSRNGIEMSVLIHGNEARIHEFEGRLFLESKLGSQYTIRLRNQTGGRVECVVAVDGLSVLSGKPASQTDAGYVLRAWESYEVKGFRADASTVGAFRFTAREAAYAKTQTGSTENVGIVSLCAWREKQPPIPQVIFKTIKEFVPYPVDRPYPVPGWPYYWEPFPSKIICGGAFNALGVNTTTDGDTFLTGVCTSKTDGDAVCLNSASLAHSEPGAPVSCYMSHAIPNQPEPDTVAVPFEHGTTWGDAVTDRVESTTFERADVVCQIDVFYNSRKRLEEMGIKFVTEKLVALPKGFPQGFASPPPGWRG